MNPEYLQAIWTLCVTAACYLSVFSDLLSPTFEAMSTEDVDSAIVVYDEIVKQDGELVNARLLRGMALTTKREFDKAIADFDEAIRLEPESGRAYCLRGQSWQLQDQFDKAILDHEKAIHLLPDCPLSYAGRAHAMMANHEKQLVSTPQPIVVDPQAPCDAESPANVFNFYGDLSKQILSDLEEAIRIDPHCYRAFCFRGYYWHKQGRLDLAVQDYDEAIELNPDFGSTYICRARLKFVKRRWTEAIADFERAIELETEPILALYEQGLTYAHLQQFDEALVSLSESIQRSPDSPLQQYRVRGVVRALKREFDGAIADFTEVLKRNPHDSEIYNCRSSAWIEKKQFLKGLLDVFVVDDLNPQMLPRDQIELVGIRVLKGAEEILARRNDETAEATEFANALRDRGLGYYTLARFEKALPDLDEAIRLDQSSSLAHATRARIWLKQCDWNRAIDDFDVAIERDPRNASLLVDRALAHCETQNWNAAKDDCTTALQIDPLQIRANARRAVAHRALGQTALAIADCDRVIANGPFYRRTDRKWMTSENQPANASSGTQSNDKSKAAGDSSNDAIVQIVQRATGASGSGLTNPNQITQLTTIGGSVNITINTANSNEVQQAQATPAAQTNQTPQHYELRLDPDCISAYQTRAMCRESAQEWSAAIADYQQLTRLVPKDTAAFRRIAWLKATCPEESCRNGTEAISFALNALSRVHAPDIDCLVTAAAAYAEAEDFETAVDYQTRAHDAAVDSCRKQLNARRQHFQSLAVDRALESKDESPATNDPGITSVALQACEQTQWKDPKLIEVLADAYADANQFEQAIECQQKVHELVLAVKVGPILDALKLYEARKPFRDETLIK